MYQKTLKSIFKSKPFCNEVFFLCFAIVLLLVSLKFPIFFLGFALYLIFIIKKTNHILPILLISTGFIISFFLQSNHRMRLEEGIYEGVFEVNEIKGNYIVLKEKRNILVSNNASLTSGDVIKAKVEISYLKEKRYSSDFDSIGYYASKRIYNQGKLLSYEIIGHKISVSSVRQNILSYYKKTVNEKSFAYIQACFFGIVDFEEEVEEAYSSLYLSHFLAISGMHLLFLFRLFCFFIQKIFKKEGSLISIIILLGYLWLIDFPISATRAFLFLFFTYLNRFSNLKYTRLDIWSLSFIFLSLLNPYSCYQMSFILSFIINFILLFMDEFIPFHPKILKNFSSTILCIFSVFPFLIRINPDVSFIGMGISFILSFFLSQYFFPFLIFFFFFFFPLPILENIFLFLDHILIFINQNMPKVRVPSMSMILILFYYAFFLMLLTTLASKKYKIRYFFLFFFYLFLFGCLRYNSPFYRVTFLDVGQGDSTLIELPYEKGNILIDSFSDNYNYLKRIGVTKLDAVILTHFDYDHMGSILNIVKEFKVKKIYYSRFEDVSKIKEINVSKIPIGQGDQIQIDSLNIQILGPVQSYSDSNSNSIVCCFKIHEFKFMFTGDMTIEEEKDILQIYGASLKSDVLKVGHHGSKTSSSNEFLQLVKPSVSVISVGNKNKYNLPANEVVEKLNLISEVYMTKDCGNIQFLIHKQMKIIPYRRRK